jgi:flagellar hook-associated protein 2
MEEAMGSPITLSGFNQIDFNTVLNAIMQQERVPVTQLETRKTALEGQKTAFGTLASKLAALESAAQALTRSTALDGSVATVSDPSRIAVASSGSAPEGSYEIVVQEVARAQVSVTGTYADRDTTIVASGGTLTIGGTTVTISGDVTLAQLAGAINSTADIGVAASVVRDATGYRLMLTGRKTGAENAFAVTNALTGGAGVTLTDVQLASDAAITINGVAATSASNSFVGIVPGLDFTVMRKDPDNPVVITITASTESVRTLVEKLVAAFNDIVKLLNEQQAAAARGDANSIARDPLVRTLRRTMASVLGAGYGSSLTHLASAGLEFTRSGELTFDGAAFDAAMQGGKDPVRSLFGGADGSGGAFGTLVATIAQYSDAGGLVPAAQNRLDAQMTAITKRITEMEDRLAVRRAALQKEFIAADQAIAQLNAQIGSLSQLGSQYRLF